MSSAFMDMNMEVGMEENPFEDGGMTAESPERKKSGIPDGFIDSADAFGENPFEPVMEPAAACLPVQEEAGSDGACEEPEESECLETDAAEEAEETDKTEESNTEVSDTEKESEDKKRAEHEAAEARRKAEWEARQQAKKDAEKAQMERIMAMGEEELISESMKRVGTDTEKLTRRNMKECVSEYIQTACLEDAAFARQVMLPQKNMVRCFQYINRKAFEYVQDEMKAAGIQPGRDTPCYSSDIPDDLCYHSSC